MVLAPMMVGYASFSNPNTAGLLWTYVKIDEQLTVSENHPPRLQSTCLGNLDAGTSNTAYRGIITRSSGGVEVGIALRPTGFSYCVFQCDNGCATDAKVGDKLMFIQGVVDPVYRDGVSPGVILVPSRNTDIGPRS